VRTFWLKIQISTNVPYQICKKKFTKNISSFHSSHILKCILFNLKCINFYNIYIYIYIYIYEVCCSSLCLHTWCMCEWFSFKLLCCFPRLNCSGSAITFLCILWASDVISFYNFGRFWLLLSFIDFKMLWIILNCHVQDSYTINTCSMFLPHYRLVVSQNGRALHIVFPHQFLDSPEWFGVSTDEYFQVRNYSLTARLMQHL
jgi:hypothetical protein